MDKKAYDVAVIGGGIVGLATAWALSQRDGARVVVLEAEAELAAHQTGHNSGVIHSGLYYKPGSLKAKNCVAGRDQLYRFCQEHGVAYEACGKIVVATRPEEVPMLDTLAERGAANGLKGLRRLRPEEIRELEPHAAGVDGLHVPETGIVDFVGMARVLAGLVEQAEGTIMTRARFGGLVREADGLRCLTSRGEVLARNLVNCAGLQSDRVARRCGLRPDVKIIPFRGEYYALAPERRNLVNNLIYPVPDPRFPFLGVHLTRMINGDVEAGPNAVLAFKREGYRRYHVGALDMAEMLGYRGFWKMGARYGGTAVKEMIRSLSKRAFLADLRTLVPALQLQDIHPHGSGVRAQAVDGNGALVDDFRVMQEERMVHVLNAPSPAATASLSIGRAIAVMSEESFVWSS